MLTLKWSLTRKISLNVTVSEMFDISRKWTVRGFLAGDFEGFCGHREALQCWPSGQELEALSPNHRGVNDMQYCHYYMMIMLLMMVVVAMIIVVVMVVVMVMGRCSMTLTAAAENYSHLCLLSSTSYIGQVMCIFCKFRQCLDFGNISTGTPSLKKGNRV